MSWKPFFILFIFTIPVAFMTIPGCKTAEKSKDAQASFETLVKNKLGAQYVVNYNTEKTHALCQQTRAGDHSQRNFKYVVIKLPDHEIVHEGSFRMGFVRWLDNQSIEVLNSSVNNDGENASDKKIININSSQL